MLQAKNVELDNVDETIAETRTPTKFRQWCEEELKPAVMG